MIVLKNVFQTQLFVAVTYLVYLYKYDCSMPKVLSIILIIDLFAFIYLFMDFYKNAYNQKVANKIKRPNVRYNISKVKQVVDKNNEDKIKSS